VRREDLKKFWEFVRSFHSFSDFLAWCAAVEDRYLQMRYAMLFYSLLFTFIASPILGAFGVESTLLHLLLAVNILLALAPIRAVNMRRALIYVVIVTWAVRFMGSLLGNFLPRLGDIFSSVMGVWTLVGLLAAAVTLRFVFTAKSIQREQIYAALSAYLLAGISFGVFYWAVERAWPGSILYGGIVPKSFSQSEGIYFSFVTLATLGYGDFVPKTDVTRGLAIVEAVAGQLYLGVMVARLVSLSLVGASEEKPAKTDAP
jgi:hypothetical protein